MLRVAALLLLLALLPGCAIADKQPAHILSFSDCVSAGYPIARSHPASCRTPDGLIFFDQPARSVPQPGLEPSRPICSDSCGNGRCEEIVCLGAGCPCPESAKGCPADCAASREKH